MSRRCRCGVGFCVNCVCDREHQPCSDLCLCFPEHCINRGLKEFQDAEEEVEVEPVIMDPDVCSGSMMARALTALAALAANQHQQQQQQQFELQ